MIETLTRLIDYLIKFRKVRETNARVYFDRYVQPIYESCEEVYKDYITLFDELTNLLKTETDPDIVLSFLENRRLEYFPVREKLRAVLNESKESRAQTDFEIGAWGILRGNISITETGDVDITPPNLDHEHPAYLKLKGDHTILYLIRELKDWDYPSHQERREHFETYRKMYLNFAAEQREAIDNAWKYLTKGYAKLHANTLP